ncbi:MAG: FlgD immunoglobulin-like domain containing protein [bacterium]|nr:FlgD immunoglobulin-like domain containing protein [bacterium]
MKRKIVFYTFVCLYLLCSLGFSQNDSLIIISKSGLLGSTKNLVPINLQNSQLIQGLELTLSYNTEITCFDVQTTDRTSDFTCDFDRNLITGHVKILLYSGSTIMAGSGPILYINFQVPLTALPGTYPLNLVDVVAVDSWVQPVQLTTVNGNFVIEDAVIPVELASFSASYQPSQKQVILEWRTHSENNNYGFEIQRGTQADQFKKIGFVPGFGTISQPRDYSFIDPKISAKQYFYRLKQIDTDGSFVFSDIVEIHISSPAEYQLSQNYPNPFTLKSQPQNTIIGFGMPEEQFVEIIIYNLLGREVKTLVSAVKSRGAHAIQWDGRDYLGTAVSSGVYYYQMKSAGFSQVRKMLILE